MDRDSCGLRFTASSDGCVSDHSFRLGHQLDSGDYYCVLANTEHGVIPGKARPGSDMCWYPYGGEEHEHSDFEWISSNGQGVLLRGATGDGEAPEGALKLGSQDDDEYYIVVAHTEEGDVPGKSKEGECWYSYDGREHNAEDFSYVVVRGHGRLYNGAKIQLQSLHDHEGTVRVNDEGEVEGNGGGGRWATFDVIYNEQDGTVKLKNEHWRRFLAIRKNGLTTGSGGRYCAFKPTYHKNGTVSFASVNFPNRHIGINDDQTARDPKHTGTGRNARFTIILKD